MPRSWDLFSRVLRQFSLRQSITFALGYPLEGGREVPIAEDTMNFRKRALSPPNLNGSSLRTRHQKALSLYLRRKTDNGPTLLWYL